MEPLASHRLRDFQQQLSRRLQQVADLHGATQDCVAGATAARHWLFDLAFIAEVIAVPAITAVPFTRPWYLGLINHRGDLAGVIDLDGLTGASVAPPRDGDRLLLLSSSLPVRCALRVAQLGGTLDRASLRELAPDTALPAWGSASYEDAAGTRRHWLDIAALLRDPAFIDISSC